MRLHVTSKNPIVVKHAMQSATYTNGKNNSVKIVSGKYPCHNLSDQIFQALIEEIAEIKSRDTCDDAKIIAFSDTHVEPIVSTENFKEVVFLARSRPRADQVSKSDPLLLNKIPAEVAMTVVKIMYWTCL